MEWRAMKKLLIAGKPRSIPMLCAHAVRNDIGAMICARHIGAAGSGSGSGPAGQGLGDYSANCLSDARL
jgi:hypothetical protein